MPSTRTTSSLVALDGTISRAACLADVLVADFSDTALSCVYRSGSVKNERSWMVTTVGRPGRSGIE
jgi:hypothetical protein